MADIIGVSITQESVRVVPGESATIGISVKNGSNVVDVLYITVEGLDPSWYQLSVVQSSIFPGDQTTGTLTITPPKTSDAVARSYAITVKSTSQKDPNQSTSLALDLHVNPSHSFEMSLLPQKVTGATCSYKLTIQNTSNTDLNIALTGQDPENLCRFTFDPQRPRVSPGEEFEVAVHVEPEKRPFRGRARGYRLTLTGTPDPGTAEPMSIPAEFDASARLPGIVGGIFSTLRRTSRAPHAARPQNRFPRRAMIAGGVAVAVIILVVVVVVATSGGSGPPFVDPSEVISSATPISRDSSKSGSITPGGDVDYFSFTAAQGTNYLLETYLTSLVGSRIYLYDPSVQPIGLDDTARILWTAPASGTYYIAVFGSDDSETGVYSLSVSVVP